MKTLMILFRVVILLSQLYGFVLSKQCTNMVGASQLFSSHTFRYELESSSNATWKKEMLSHYHLTPTDDSAWSDLFPRKMLKEEDKHSWEMMYRNIKNLGGVKGMLNEVSLNDVRLDPNSMHGKAQNTNLEYLLMLDVDRLVWSFRKTAGLETTGEPYGGWEGSDVELRGHFVGHYMSASAQMWASTHNETLKGKMTAVVSVLSACQEKLGTGYLSAFPSELFDRFEAVQPVWAPYYTIHKILAGLFDQYSLAGSDQALKIMTWMVEYFYNRVQSVILKHSVERHYLSLNEETGGMNDILYKLYSITGNQKHLVLAHLFDKPCFLGLLAIQADDISGFHANTHIPVVVGAQMRYEVTGDPLYKEIGTFFLNIVNSSHSYATGGTSVSEFWSDPKRLADTLQSENEESCTTYNMLKVSRHLFRWTKEMAYADYYERALTNGVLSIQRGTDPGIMIYMLPLSPGGSKARSYHKWGTKYDSFWCCYGTGIESFSKLGDSIYFEEEGNTPGLYVIQYISSSFKWRLGKISIKQEVEQVVSWNPRFQVKFTITSKEAEASGTSTLNLRVPLWTRSDGAKASLNGHDIPLTSPGNFIHVTRNWNTGDEVTLDLPITFRTEALKDDRADYSSLQAIFYGPYLLAGHSNGDWDVNANSALFSDWITPVPSSYNSQLVSFTQELTSDKIFAVANSNQTMKMEELPEAGSDSALSSSFRLIPAYRTSKIFWGPADFIGESIMLEPFNYPGKLIVHNGEKMNLEVTDSSKAVGSVFRLVKGLNDQNGIVSLESEDKKGCFVYSGVDYKAGTGIKLMCSTKSDEAGFENAASFSMRKGFREYHPISFMAKGLHRNFVLSPLLSFRDESYTVYFNFKQG